MAWLLLLLLLPPLLLPLLLLLLQDLWFRAFNATEQKNFRAEMGQLSFGQLVRWADEAGLVRIISCRATPNDQ